MNPPPSGSGIYRYERNGGTIYPDAIEASFTNPPEDKAAFPSFVDIPLEFAKALGILTPEGELNPNQPELWARQFASTAAAAAIAVFAPNTFQIEAAGQTDVGLSRSVNEDAFAVVPELGLYIVADGMGGHGNGDTASKIAVETIEERMRSTGSLLDAVLSANRVIVEHPLQEKKTNKMGTTVAVLQISGDRVYVAHVGDSRVYRIRDGALTPLTKDHSLVAHYMKAMNWTRDEAICQGIPENILMQALGSEPNTHLQVDVLEGDAKAGDAFLLCSDGLWGVLNEETMRDMTLTFNDPQVACRELIARANEGGGPDNITVIVVKIK